MSNTAPPFPRLNVLQEVRQALAIEIEAIEGISFKLDGRVERALEMMLEIEGGGTRMIRHHGQLMRVETPAAMAADWDDENRWKVVVMKTVATDGSGILELRERIEGHWHWLQESGEMAVREQLRIAHSIENIVRAELNRRMLQRLPATGISAMVEAVRTRASDPYSAAATLLQHL